MKTWSQRINKHYRRWATGFCFLTFMTAGLGLTFLILPLIRILPIKANKRQEFRFNLIHKCFRTFTKLMCLVGVIRSFKVTGLDTLPRDRAYLFIANHPTLIDVVTMLGVIPYCNCIVKSELFKHPFMGGVLRGTGLLPNDGGLELLEILERDKKLGRSLMIFPEGTRSPEGGLNPFNRGAARLALHMDYTIIPVLITCTPITLMKGRPWHDVPDRAVDFSLTFGEPMDIPQEVLNKPHQPLKVRALNRHMQGYFEKELGI